MGTVIKCPNTGQEVPPRFQTAEALCDAAILIDNPFTCPACGQLHEWEINDLPTGGPQDLARPPLSPST
jgi:hypothetical protein